jgi:hypothetical protein
MAGSLGFKPALSMLCRPLPEIFELLMRHRCAQQAS